MKPVTVLSLRWPWAIMASLMLVPMLVPSTYMLVAGLRHEPGAVGPDGEGLWRLVLLASACWTGWACLWVIPIVRPRRLILDENGVTLDTVWRSRQWGWQHVAGVWPLGGYKPQLELDLGGDTRRRVFLGSHWPGDTA